GCGEDERGAVVGVTEAAGVGADLADVERPGEDAGVEIKLRIEAGERGKGGRGIDGAGGVAGAGGVVGESENVGSDAGAAVAGGLGNCVAVRAAVETGAVEMFVVCDAVADARGERNEVIIV